MSACLHGEIPHLLIEKKREEALEAAREYKEMFDNRRFYLELQANGIEDQIIANRGMVQISKELDIPLVATNDCHYLDKEDVRAHEVLVAVRTGKTLSDDKRLKFSTEDLFFKSPELMKSLFKDYPEAIANTVEIAERCNVELEFGKLFFPVFPLEGNETATSRLRTMALEGLQKRMLKHPQRQTEEYPAIEKAYHDRLEIELNVIETEGFSGYFLIVSDFVNYSKQNDVPVGPGRGSAAGVW